MERKHRLISIYIQQLVKLIFGQEPLRFSRKSRLVGNLPYRGIWEDIEVESQMCKNYPIFSEESFEFKKLKLNEQGHIHKVSESAKNTFLYPNFKSKSFVTNLFLAL